ncbi:hypothetical protein DFH08DRAFT_887690 [Mycena albidolilacea]|uniref:Uncharacterized protein n=1 Tax=Mycena albidolilacea TaxID=1033008 RepID=A0AAD6ZI12_9AGAR|nr:hypothetical protein DFH08DRAFT_887690 [Mycena albidolilacea]
MSGSSDLTIRVWDVMSVLNKSSTLPGASISSGHNLLNTLLLKSPSMQLHWQINDGWVSCNPLEPLFWLPTHHRIGLWSPHTTLVIGRRQSCLSYDKFVHGTDWAQCYAPGHSHL